MGNVGEQLFGQIAVKNRMVAAADVEWALAEQERARQRGESVTIGQMMMLLGLLTHAQVERVITIQRFLDLRVQDKSLGQLAIRNRFLSEKQVQQCLETQKRAWLEKGRVERIGEIMVGLGFLTEPRRDALLASQEPVKKRWDSTVIRPEGLVDTPNSKRPPVEVVVHPVPPAATDTPVRAGSTEPTRYLDPGAPTPSVEVRGEAAGEKPPASARAPEADPNESGPLIALRTCAYCQSTTDGEKSRCTECTRRSCIYCGTVAEDDQSKCADCGAALAD